MQGLRSYAVFLEEVMHDSDQSQEFLTKARRLEESYMAAKACSVGDSVCFGAPVDTSSQMDEHDAVLVLSGAASRLGEITSVNAKSSTMLSLQRVVLLGRYVHSLFPAPVSGWVAGQLESFAARGECYLMDNPVVMPVLTGAGVLVPAVLHLKPHPPECEGSHPQLMLVLKPVATTAELAMFDTQVRHCCCALVLPC